MSLFFFLKMGAGAVLNLDGATIAVSNTATCTSQVKIDNDGNVYERRNLGSWTQIDTTADWIRPAHLSPGSYEVRYTSKVLNSGVDTLVCSQAAEDTWYALSGGDFTVTVDQDVDIPTINSLSFDIEIRKGSSGVAEVTGSYTLSANYDTT